MADTTIIKVDSAHSPKGPDGQIYLALGKSLAMRLWKDERAGDWKQSVAREYETAGYVLSGRAELEIEGQRVTLKPGDSWIVPAGASHRYRIVETFSAVEATHPPAEVHDRDR